MYLQILSGLISDETYSFLSAPNEYWPHKLRFDLYDISSKSVTVMIIEDIDCCLVRIKMILAAGRQWIYVRIACIDFFHNTDSGPRIAAAYG